MNALKNTTIFLEGKPINAANSNSAPAPAEANANENTNSSTGTTNSTVPAADVPADPFGGMGILGMVVLYGGLFFALWFFIFRPQKKREKVAKEMQESLKVGENIVTSSGFFGKIVGVGQDSFLVEFGENKGVRIWVRKTDIVGVKTPITTPPPKTEAEIDAKK